MWDVSALVKVCAHSVYSQPKTMDREKRNLKGSAEVHWRNPSPHQPSRGNHRRRFATLTDAVRFVMEDLTDFPQSTARIETEEGELTLEDIRKLHVKLSSV
jgi:hypothetical protein